MSGFALLWSKMLVSSLWRQESKETRLVWITLLMMKDSNGIVQSSMIGVADSARVTLGEAKQAIKILLAPDKGDTSKVENGKRLREVPGGWQIVNHDLYRFSTEAKREFWRAQKAEQRAKEEAAQKAREARRGASAFRGKPNTGEVTGAAAIDNGDLKTGDSMASQIK